MQDLSDRETSLIKKLSIIIFSFLLCIFDYRISCTVFGMRTTDFPIESKEFPEISLRIVAADLIVE